MGTLSLGLIARAPALGACQIIKLPPYTVDSIFRIATIRYAGKLYTRIDPAGPHDVPRFMEGEVEATKAALAYYVLPKTPTI